jgi:hypothetical protein
MAAACAAAWHVQVSSEKAVVRCADVQVVALDQPISSKTSLNAVTASASPTCPRICSSCKIQSFCRRSTIRDLTTHQHIPQHKKKQERKPTEREGTSKVPSLCPPRTLTEANNIILAISHWSYQNCKQNSLAVENLWVQSTLRSCVTKDLRESGIPSQGSDIRFLDKTLAFLFLQKFPLRRLLFWMISCFLSLHIWAIGC